MRGDMDFGSPWLTGKINTGTHTGSSWQAFCRVAAINRQMTSNTKVNNII
jgi:hypothetical protein